MPLRESSWRRSDGGIAAAIVVATGLLQIPFSLKWVSLLDEGLILQIADDLTHGHRLYVDAVHVALPGVFYLTAAAFAVFGSSLATARGLAACIFAVIPGMAYLISRWWLCRNAALAIALFFLAYRVWAFPHWQMVSYSSLAVMLALVATWACGAALGKPTVWMFSLAGALAGLAILAKQDSGVATAGALELALLFAVAGGRRPDWRRLAAFNAGVSLVLSAMAILAWWGSFGRELLAQAILAPLYNAWTFDYPRRPALWPFWQQDPVLRANFFSYFPSILVDLHWSAILRSWIYTDTPLPDAALKLIFHLPWLLLLLVGIPVARRFRSDRRDLRTQREMLLILVAAAFFVAFSRPHDWAHLLVLYPPTVLLAGILWSRSCRPWLASTVAWSGVGAAAAASAVLALEFYHDYSLPLRTGRGTIYVKEAQSVGLAEVLHTLEEAAPTRALAALPYQPLLNFLSGRRGVSRFYYLWPVEYNRNRDAEIVRDLEADPNALLVYCTTVLPHFPEVSQYAQPLFSYLVRHVVIDRVFGANFGGFTFLVLQRSEPRQGRSLLGEALDRAEITVDGPDGQVRRIVGKDRHSVVSEALWPFYAVAATAATPGRGTQIRYEIEPSVGQRFVTAYAIDPRQWGGIFLPPVRFSVRVGPDEAQYLVLDAEVDPERNPRDRAWASVEVDLSHWAGETIALSLRTEVPAEFRGGPVWAGWGEPRLVDAPR
jgi:4-amino-4-deoxy-L-arabinose transferase-like glycosyltransferase